jgi:hypothetical protein
MPNLSNNRTYNKLKKKNNIGASTNVSAILSFIR